MQIVDLGTGGAARSIAQAINGKGQIAGAFEFPTHAFRWDPGAGFTDLGTLEGRETAGQAINGHGDVVGATYLSYGTGKSEVHHAILWPIGEPARDLGSLGGMRSSATGINDERQIVGVIDHGTFLRGFLREPSGKLIDIGTLGGSSSRAWGVNNAGQVVGASRTIHGAFHAFLWQQGTGMMDLGTIGGLNSEALAINDGGQVVGWSEDWWNNDPRAFVWSGGAMRALPHPPGVTRSAANHINRLGQIVGAAPSEPGDPAGKMAACLWQNRLAVSLPSLTSWSAANGINDLGEIVGVAGTYTGRNAVLWAPGPPAP